MNGFVRRCPSCLRGTVITESINVFVQKDKDIDAFFCPVSIYRRKLPVYNG